MDEWRGVQWPLSWLGWWRGRRGERAGGGELRGGEGKSGFVQEWKSYILTSLAWHRHRRPPPRGAITWETRGRVEFVEVRVGAGHSTPTPTPTARAVSWQRLLLTRHRPRPLLRYTAWFSSSIAPPSPNLPPCMSSPQPKPAWLTDELADVEEWVDWQDEAHSLDIDQSGSELSFTQPLGSVLVRNSDLGSSPASTPTAATDDSGGTFIVREELPALPLLPKTPGRNKKPAVKDFFSPLALEKMFEPPSPPHYHASLPSTSRPTAAPPVPSRLSQVHVPPSESSVLDDDDNRPTSAVSLPIEEQERLRVEGPQGQFTFTAPRPSPFNPACSIPDAQSTPGPNNPTHHLNPPPTDPRLRLFQFQYDTFTRDHLSAMVDSIAVNTPSGDGGPTSHSSRRTTPSILSPVEESSFSRLRSAKRVKLSPASDFSREKGDGAAIIIRPVSRRDYVGESKNLMDQIRQARDFSTVSTVATARSPAAESAQALDHLVKEPPPLRA